MAQKQKKQKKQVKKKGYSGGKPDGLNYVQMLQWQNSLQEQAAEFAKNETQRVVADRQAQRVGWLYLIALAEQHGFSASDLEELEQQVAILADEYKQLTEKNDQDYSDEQLRAAVSEVLGREVRYVHDNLPMNSDTKDDYISGLRESESRIY